MSINDDEAQRTWVQYYENLKQRRSDEADELWKQAVDAGVTEDSVIAIDFVCFSRDATNAKDLAEPLSENYRVEVIPKEEDYILVKGTTRPTGVCLTQSDHLSWVVFMCDVAQSYASVFSTWTLDCLSLGLRFESEEVDGGG